METDITFILNQEVIRTKINPAIVLLDFIRNNKRLTGTKEVCKEGDCGACAVLLGEMMGDKVRYKTINSCLFPILKVNGKHIVTIEGLNQDKLTPIQSSFENEGASQCGFCTPGFIISLSGYLLNANKFSLDDAINSVGGNICRCTGYHSIIRSINSIRSDLKEINLTNLISCGFIPSYFREIHTQLNEIQDVSNEKRYFNNLQIISGGTDLFVQKPTEMLNRKIGLSEDLIDNNIWIEDSNIKISGSSTINDLELFVKNNDIYIDLSKLFLLFASRPVKNSATIAGNIINASPIADITITLLVLNARLKLINSEGIHRTIPLNTFYTGYKTFDKSDDEIIEAVSFPIPTPKTMFNFEKVSKRTHLDIASVNCAILLDVDKTIINSVSISAGGVSPIPLYLKKTSEFLMGKVITEKLVSDAVDIIEQEISPISDIRGSAEYKTLLLRQLFKAHFFVLFPEIITPKVLDE